MTKQNQSSWHHLYRTRADGSIFPGQRHIQQQNQSESRSSSSGIAAVLSCSVMALALSEDCNWFLPQGRSRFHVEEVGIHPTISWAYFQLGSFFWRVYIFVFFLFFSLGQLSLLFIAFWSKNLWFACYLLHFGAKICHLHAHLAFGFWLLAFGFWPLAFGFWVLALVSPGFCLLAFGWVLVL